MFACLFASMIVVGSFQGSLTKAFNSVEYYKEIDTLAALDESGLPIGTSSKSLIDLFGVGDTPVLRSLISKFSLYDSGSSIIDRTAYDRDICCIERCSDIQLIIVVSMKLFFSVGYSDNSTIETLRIQTKYENINGTALLHPMRESPRSCQFAYIVKKGWPFSPVFQEVLHRFREAGL